METKYCTECSEKNLITAKYCLACGTQLGVPQNNISKNKISAQKTKHQTLSFDTSVGERLQNENDDEADLQGINLEEVVDSLDNNFIEGFFGLVAAHGIEPKKSFKLGDAINTSKNNRKSIGKRQNNKGTTAKDILKSTESRRKRE